MIQFIVLFSLLAASPTEKKNLSLDCSEFKKGKFIHLNENKVETATTIERDDKYQVEKTSSGIVANYEIVWTSGCSYYLVYLKGNLERNPAIDGKNLQVHILEVQGNMYKYVCFLQGMEEYKQYGWLKKVD